MIDGADMIENVIRIDREIVPFDSSEITSQLAKIGERTGEYDERTARKLTLRVLTVMHDLRFGPTVEMEEVQDVVERVLLDSPFVKSTRTFIIERHELSTEALIAEHIKRLEEVRMRSCSICLKESENLLKLNEDTRFRICNDCADELPLLLDEKGLLNRIKKTISFTPETKQAGMSILSYFGDILEKKYPNINTRVKIEQENLKVTMIVETSDGEVEKIEEALESYGLVIMGRQEPEELLRNQYDVMLLRQKLELANLEIKQKTELLQMARLDKEGQNERIDSLEKQIQSFHEIIGTNILIKKNEQDFLLNIIDRYSLNHEMADKLEFIVRNFESGNFLKNEKQIKASLELLNKSHPSIIKELYSFTKGTLTGVAGNILYNWIAPFLYSIPK